MHILKYLLFAAGLVAALPHANPKKKSIILPFRRAASYPKHGPLKRALAERQDNSSTNDDVSELYNNNNARYLATTILAGQEMTLILDTGSSDTFVFSVRPEDEKNMSSAEIPALFNNQTAEGVTYLDLVYNATYGEGEGITNTLGAIGMTQVKLNGTDLTADNLTFANLYHSNAGTGGQGLLGLGFPFLSDIFWSNIWAHNATGTPLTASESQKFFPLVPLLHYQQKIEKPLFGILADRIPGNLIAPGDTTVFNYTSGGGSLTIGDYPEGYTGEDFTWSDVPIVRLDESRTSAGASPAAGYKWEIPIDAIYFNGKHLENTTETSPEISPNGTYLALVDTGNPAMVFPPDMMSQITDAWAANPNNSTMPCDGDFELVIQIGGTNFTMAKEDMVVPSYQANDGIGSKGRASSNCQFQAQAVSPSPSPQGTGHAYAFGDTFLRNVVTMYDYGNLLNATLQAPRMGFAQR